jgi:ATP-dependent Clp protease ATP-binding subunit ClpA
MKDVPRLATTLHRASQQEGTLDPVVLRLVSSQRLLVLRGRSGAAPSKVESPLNLRHVFLQALKVRRKNAVAIMTANLAASLSTDVNQGSGCATAVSESSMQGQGTNKWGGVQGLHVSHEVLSPECIHALGMGVRFSSLSMIEQSWILDRNLGELSKGLLRNNGIVLEVSEETRALLLKKGSSETEGVRSLRRAIQELVIDRLETAVSGLDSTKGLIFRVTPTGFSISQE